MNVVQKRSSVVGFTVFLILFASASLYGQDYRYVFYLDSAPNLHTLYALSACDSHCGWTDVKWANTPAPGSALTIVNHNGGAQLFYVDTAQRVQEVSNVDTTGSWYSTCVTCAAGAPAAAAGSALTSFIDYSAYITHVFYEGTNGNIYELYCSCESSTSVWHWDDPTSLAGGAPVAASGSALTSFIDGGVMHVFYLGTNNKVYELYWISGTTWHSDDPTSLAGAPVATSGSALTSFLDSSGFMHVFYLSSQNVHELYWTGGSTWHTDDANSEAGAPSTAVGSVLTSFVNTSGMGDTGMHVLYLGTNEHVYALHSSSSPTWSYFDATAASGGVAAVSGSHLTSFQDIYTEGVRLYFLGTNSHVYELYWASEGAATETDLTASSGAGSTATNSALAGIDGMGYKP